MPPFSRTIDEEGALFEGECIVSDGVLDRTGVELLLSRGPYPARNTPQNLADLAAQLAANARGAAELSRLVRQHGDRVVAAYLRPRAASRRNARPRRATRAPDRRHRTHPRIRLLGRWRAPYCRSRRGCDDRRRAG
jgi:5-oxoprolinase (ATP-hydrolysing)